jgi:hypothetical protein
VVLPAGIAESLKILRFQRALRKEEGPAMEDVLRRIIAVFERAQSPWALVGAQAVNLYVRPRATVDLDFVVETRKLTSIVKLAEEEFGELRTHDVGAALRLLDISVDLIRSDNHALFRAALDLAREEQGLRVPPAELIVVLKFMSAVSPWRDPADRRQDAADLIRIYRTVGAGFDRDAALGHAKRAFPGAGKELAEVFDRIDRGEDIAL